VHPTDARTITGRTLLASGLTLAALALLWVALVIAAPVDGQQGVVQKILYVHVPCAFAAYLGFAITAVAGALYLWKNQDRFDRVAAAGAEVGVLFCTLTVLTGPIWARATWGHWWAWDPRLTVTLMLWLIYVAYLLLRGFTEGSVRTARFAAVYGIAGLMAVPLNYFAIDLFGGTGMHPENLERGSLGAGMRWPLAIGVATGIAALVHLLLLRIDLGARRMLAAASGEHEVGEGKFPP
jgi:heme exporter protein C